MKDDEALNTASSACSFAQSSEVVYEMTEQRNEESTDVCDTYTHHQSKAASKFPVEFHLGQWIFLNRKRDTKAERKRRERLAKSVN